ncbi:MAG: putative class III extradiol dioxygenase MEMO1 family [Candidatus Methanohalarchaeum thermophilum]|uniref:MEMO1 family protein BTN85_1777 n=1 Tax=Methanohalarchaeum thermophilum TaxID=1903181 RepID=A0A1Q6DS26_METT1|nr:MAG: putative class III extradiol dioxygenase MEMO1 family [Candidatus Methanohalarchaeum thermophilum]
MRKPAVAGKFYPNSKKKLKQDIKKYAGNNLSKKAKAAVSPHAGYIYSGKTAVKSIASLKEASNYVILGPNHHGIGSGIALSDQDWETPLGQVEVNKEISERLRDIGVFDERAHKREHSIEVQVPILQYFFDDFQIIPICMSIQDEETTKKLGERLAEISEERDISIVASSDFTHYQPLEIAKRQDMEARKKIEELDVKGFYDLIRQNNLSICGYGPIATLMNYSKKLGLESEFIEYSTSADQTGDESQVVGYVSMCFK